MPALIRKPISTGGLDQASVLQLIIWGCSHPAKCSSATKLR
uniref:Uncharacterized protein n=1 Tax=Anguilla anguilla TaxID=7936 RepID=A0A0E9Q6B0_ANGAN